MQSNAMKTCALGAMILGGTLGVSSKTEAALVVWNCNLAVTEFVGTDLNYGLRVNLETRQWDNDTTEGSWAPGWTLQFTAGYPTMGISGYGINNLTSQDQLVGGKTGTALTKLPSGTSIGSTFNNSKLGWLLGLGLDTFSSASSGLQKWKAGDTGYFGFRFENAAGQMRYGWGQLALNSGSLKEGTVVSLVYDDSGASVTTGVVPAPGAAALLGAAGLVGVRRRRN